MEERAMSHTFSIQPQPDGPGEVFGLATPHHMLMKLYWEVAALEKAISDSKPPIIDPTIYHAYNCAVTAWHCADWAWNSADLEGQQILLRTVGSDGNSENEFFDAVCVQSREVYACRRIANGSKHMKLRSADPSIKVGIEWHYRSDRAKQVPYVFDSAKSQPAELLFRKAAEYWHNLFSDVGYCEAPFVC